jgi:PAS domain S-box-containing protein
MTLLENLRAHGTLLAVAAACLAAALMIGAEVALEVPLSLERADARLKEVAGRQRMLAERMAQTALRMADAEPALRATLARDLDATLREWTLHHEAFRSVGAGSAAPGPGLAPLELPEWQALDKEYLRLQSSARALDVGREGQRRAPDATVLRRAAATSQERARSFQALTERWLDALDRRHGQRLDRHRSLRRAMTAGALVLVGLAATLPRPRRAPLQSAAAASLAEVQERLGRSERRYRTLVERCPNAVVVVLGGGIAYANRAAARIWGAPDPAALVGRPIGPLFHADDRAVVEKRLGQVALGSASVGPLEVGVVRDAAGEGAEGQVLLHAAPISYGDDDRPAAEVILVDVTRRRFDDRRRRSLEARLRTAERLQSLALMAGGVAHDFNNLLGTIIANAELALGEVTSRERGDGSVGEILSAARAASELVEQLLAYAGQGEGEQVEVDVAAVVADTVRLMLPRVPDRATLRLDCEPHLPPVRGDRAQVRQVAMNLVQNAFEALDDSPGRVDIAVRRGRIDRELLDAGQHADDVRMGPCVLIEVRDTGSGMDVTTRARLFDPFYTTKFAGRGLGLAAVLGIVRRHRGAIAVASEPGEGSLFRVALPVF